VGDNPWIGSGPVLCCFAVFSAGETQNLAGRFTCRRCCRVSFRCCVVPWFASFVKQKGFILFAHFSTASLIGLGARSAATEGKKNKSQERVAILVLELRDDARTPQLLQKFETIKRQEG